MPNCTACGGHVSATFARVMADRDGAVACPSCNDLETYDFLPPTLMATYQRAPP